MGIGFDLVLIDDSRIHPGLLKNPRTFLLPHMGTSTYETQKAMEVLVLDNLKSALAGKGLLTQVPEQVKSKL